MKILLDSLHLNCDFSHNSHSPLVGLRAKQPTNVLSIWKKKFHLFTAPCLSLHTNPSSEAARSSGKTAACHMAVSSAAAAVFNYSNSSPITPVTCQPTWLRRLKAHFLQVDTFLDGIFLDGLAAICGLHKLLPVEQAIDWLTSEVWPPTQSMDLSHTPD